MLKSHERFYAKNGKRLVLVVDDEAVNREMLSMILSDRYEVLQAADGQEALTLIQENEAVLSLILLDLMMPVLSGMELLHILKEEPALERIPVIVLTSEKRMEVESLQQGAADFIAKPFDLPDVILARVQRTIELAEDTYIIQNTERDDLTGLLNRNYFYSYIEQYDLHHADTRMDAAVININNFRLVNELQGRAFGDRVLQKTGACILDMIPLTGGVAGRGNADMFLLYVPEGTDYDAIHARLMKDLEAEGIRTRLHLRLGIYPRADLSLAAERRFDRAKMAADAIRGNYTRTLSYYDGAMHERELEEQRLIDDMETALAERQFQVYYQPKFGIQGEQPVLRSAEALVRWEHPELGRISPGRIIPLFERNGLIQRLDRYIWAETARQMRVWRETLGVTLPVSVNVSRIDIYAKDFLDCLENLVQENGIDPADFLIEVTESAYTEESDQITRTVRALQDRGFRVEMDDFGSGYSSLNMLADLPVDVLKLDMHFVRNMHASEKNIQMVGLVIDIAKRLNTLVVAEGVETEEQVRDLKRLGCDLAQGYYFSKPVPASDFERLILECKKEGRLC